MGDVRISCAGARAGTFILPPFTLRIGEAICLHLPTAASADAEGELTEILIGSRSTPGYRTFGRVLFAEPAVDHGNRFLRLFRPLRAADWLRRQTGVAPEEGRAVLQRLGVERDWPLNRLPGNPRLFLGLEAAWMGGAQAVVFGTAGCDLSGVQAAFAAVASRLESCPAVYLSRPFLEGGAFHRNHFPGAMCVELPGGLTTPLSAESA